MSDGEIKWLAIMAIGMFASMFLFFGVQKVVRYRAESQCMVQLAKTTQRTAVDIRSICAIAE